MEASRPARACGFLSFWSRCVEPVHVLTRVKWEAAEGCGDIDGRLTACQLSFTSHVISYHDHTLLQLGKLRHSVPHLARGGVQQVELSLLGLIGCSPDLSPNVTDREDAERASREREEPPAFLPSCLPAGGGGAGLVRCWGSWAGVGGRFPGSWPAPALLLASFVFACRVLSDLS